MREGGGELPEIGLLHRAQVLATAGAIVEAERLAGRRRSDREMAALLGVSLRTFLRAVKADPDVLLAATLLPRPGKEPIRRWRAWEVEARWSGAVLPRRRKAAP